jgi:hypothetical protein
MVFSNNTAIKRNCYENCVQSFWSEGDWIRRETCRYRVQRRKQLTVIVRRVHVNVNSRYVSANNVTYSVNRSCLSKLSNRPRRSSAVRHWLPTAAARVRVRAACGVSGGQSGSGASFLRVLRFPLPIIPPISPLS